MWQLFNLAKTYHCRASDLLGIENTWDRFKVDRSVAVFGNALKAELEEVEGKKKKEIQKKRDQVLSRWFPEARSAEPKKFKDPGSV